VFGPIRAVAIDDVPHHLLSITTGLSTIGVPCIGYWYDRDSSELRPAPPEGGLPHLRIIFSDLNLAELGGVPETQALWSVVVSVLKQIVSKNSGPYLLVFWTAIENKAAEVREMLFARADQLEGIPCPIDVLELPKASFLMPTPQENGFEEGLREFYANLHASIDQLRRAVADAVNRNVSLNVVSGWETRAAEAAALAMNEVHRCARTDEPDPSAVSGSMAKVITRIAQAASGRSSAVAEPARAVDAGMIDILIDQIGSTVDAQEYKDAVVAAIGPTVSTEVQFNDSSAMCAELNTFFHLDRDVAAAKSWDRGVVIPADSFNKGELGFNTTVLLTAEFLFPYELFEEERHSQIQEDIRRARQEGRFVLIEIGADCDHAQNHGRTRRFLVGFELPETLLHLADKNSDGKLRNGALELLGPWKIDGQMRYLLVSCRRFWTWQRDTPPQATPRYRLRASLIDKLLHRYASWSSRPGIVEFRPKNSVLAMDGSAVGSPAGAPSAETTQRIEENEASPSSPTQQTHGNPTIS
jgi:hypothetical protein